jgi:hypothetical protein
VKVPRNYRKPLPLLEVVWSDSQLSTGGWEDHGATMRSRERILQRSVGYILADDKKGVMLAGSLSQGGNVHGVVTIPASQIVKKRRVR